MDINHQSTELLFVTVPILTINKENQQITGTGFIISISETNQGSIPVLVTNQHVIKNAKHIYIDLFKGNAETGKPITEEKLKIEIDGDLFENFQSEELDIAFIPLAPILQKLNEQKITVFFKAITTAIACSKETEDKLSAIEEVIFIGYPSGLQEQSKKLPLIRKGITATAIWANYNNNKSNETFLIDAGVFPGSSGSPVLIYNQGAYSTGTNITIGTRIIFLGMLKSSLQLIENKQFIGLGEVIKSRVVFDFVSKKLNITNTNQ